MDDGTVVDLAAYTLPPMVFDGKGRLLDHFSYLDSVEAWGMTYLSDGLRVKGYYVKPKGVGPFPCLIYNRGGNRDFGAIGDQVIVGLLCRIASWGYLVVASQYRGGSGSEGRDEFGGADLNDVLNLFPLLDADGEADGSRIGMYGASRGGMMTYLALARDDRVKAAVIRCGVSDLTTWDEERKDMEEVYKDLIPGFAEDREGTLSRRSAVLWAERLSRTTPLLLLQGSADWRVNPRSALRMAERLLELRHPFRLLMLEGADHALTETLDERNGQTRAWLDRFVRDRGALPDMEPHGD